MLAVTSAVAILPLLARFDPLFVTSDLIAFAMHDKQHADRSKRRRKDQDQNPTFQSCNYLGAGGSCLRVAKSAALRKSWKRK
jgi:hypothetical protein